MALDVFVVVVTEWRLIVEVILEANHFPARLVVIAAIFGIREKSHDGVDAHHFKEGRVLNGVEQLHLLFRGKLGEFPCRVEHSLGPGLKVGKPMVVIRLAAAIKSSKRAINKVDNVSLTRTRSLVCRDDLGSNGFYFCCAFRGKELQSRRWAGSSHFVGMLLRLQDG